MWPTATGPASHSFERSSFCLSCHDADGATIITGRTDPDADATTNALNPFNDGVTNAHEPDWFRRHPGPPLARQPWWTSRNAVRHRRTSATTRCLGPAYVYVSRLRGFGGSAPLLHGGRYRGAQLRDALWIPGRQLAIQGERTDLDWDSVIDCEDCHIGPPALWEAARSYWVATGRRPPATC